MSLMKYKEINHRKGASEIFMVIGAIAVLIVLFISMPRLESVDETKQLEANKSTRTSEESDGDEPYVKKQRIRIGTYNFYVPGKAEIFCENTIWYASFDNVDVRGYSFSGAPETDQAVYDLFGTYDTEPFKNKYDVEGVIVHEDNPNGWIAKIYCFTIDGNFQAIEVWTKSDNSKNEKIWMEIFNSTHYQSEEAYHRDIINEENLRAYEESVEIERIMHYYNNAYEPDNELPAGAKVGRIR